jgi:hypothetical protein
MRLSGSLSPAIIVNGNVSFWMRRINAGLRASANAPRVSDYDQIELSFLNR